MQKKHVFAGPFLQAKHEEYGTAKEKHLGRICAEQVRRAIALADGREGSLGECKHMQIQKPV
jgi:hypothetical protein